MGVIYPLHFHRHVDRLWTLREKHRRTLPVFATIDRGGGGRWGGGARRRGAEHVCPYQAGTRRAPLDVQRLWTAVELISRCSTALCRNRCCRMRAAGMPAAGRESNRYNPLASLALRRGKGSLCEKEKRSLWEEAG